MSEGDFGIDSAFVPGISSDIADMLGLGLKVFILFVH
jgi:hypothetical protein